MAQLCSQPLGDRLRDSCDNSRTLSTCDTPRSCQCTRDAELRLRAGDSCTDREKNILFSLLCDGDSQESDAEVTGELVCSVSCAISQAESSLGDSTLKNRGALQKPAPELLEMWKIKSLSLLPPEDAIGMPWCKPSAGPASFPGSLPLPHHLLQFTDV